MAAMCRHRPTCGAVFGEVAPRGAVSGHPGLSAPHRWSMNGFTTLAEFSGTWATSVPIVHIDTGTNVPFTPNGGDITLAWNAEGVFKVKNQ